MTSFTGLALNLVLLALFFYGLYWVVNRGVLHALRQHHREVSGPAPADRHPAGG
jgi:hypothetical protein